MDLVELHAAGRTHEIHPWESARLQFIFRQISNCLSSPEDTFNLLEVGCGNAFVASQIASHWTNARVWGYDPFFDEATLKKLRDDHCENANLELIESLNQLPDNEVVNIVAFFDVLEHIEDDVAALREIRSHSGISDNSCYLITVPAFQGLFSSHDDFMKHYRRYNKSLLSDHLAQAGLQVERMHYFFFSLLLPRWIKVLAEKTGWKSAQKGVSAWKGGKLITEVLKAALTVDWKISILLNRLGISLPGLSLFCLCRPVAS